MKKRKLTTQQKNAKLRQAGSPLAPLLKKRQMKVILVGPQREERERERFGFLDCQCSICVFNTRTIKLLQSCTNDCTFRINRNTYMFKINTK